MGEPGGLPSMGSHRVGHDWSDLAAAAAAASISLAGEHFHFDTGLIRMKSFAYKFVCPLTWRSFHQLVSDSAHFKPVFFFLHCLHTSDAQSFETWEYYISILSPMSWFQVVQHSKSIAGNSSHFLTAITLHERDWEPHKLCPTEPKQTVCPSLLDLKIKITTLRSLCLREQRPKF